MAYVPLIRIDMTIHPIQEADASAAGVRIDSTRSPATASSDSTIGTAGASIDSTQAIREVPVQESTGLERTMLAQDKLYVVLAVVLIIWIGLAFFVWRTDRKIERLERNVGERIAGEEDRS